MDYIKIMSAKEFSSLPSYDKASIEQGKTYRLFGNGYNVKANIGYIKVINTVSEEKVDSKIHKVQIKD